MKKTNADLWRIWAGSLALSLLLAGLFYASGKSNDCRPGQIDGQCGLSTFLGLIYGVGCAVLVQGITIICLAAVAWKRGKITQASSR